MLLDAFANIHGSLPKRRSIASVFAIHSVAGVLLLADWLRQGTRKVVRLGMSVAPLLSATVHHKVDWVIPPRDRASLQRSHNRCKAPSLLADDFIAGISASGNVVVVGREALHLSEWSWCWGACHFRITRKGNWSMLVRGRRGGRGSWSVGSSLGRGI
jgi:hypothetical protein